MREGITRFCRCAPAPFKIYLLVWQVAGVQVVTEPLRELGQEKTTVQEDRKWNAGWYMQRRNALEGRNAMIPSMDIHKQFMFEHVRELQREAEQERMLAGQRKPYRGIVRYLIGCLSTFFVVPVTSMQQLEQQDQQAVCNCTRDKTPYRKDLMMNPQVHAEEQLNIAT